MLLADLIQVLAVVVFRIYLSRLRLCKRPVFNFGER